jgi:cysteinyl-tRNA synthetase
MRDFPKTDDELMESEFENKFIEAMDDDFNTPIALSVLFELAHEIQRLREKDEVLSARHAILLKKLGGVLGILQDDPLNFFQGKKENLDVEKIEKLIAARNQARADKNWGEADRIRKELSDMSIVLEDGSSGTGWKQG